MIQVKDLSKKYKGANKYSLKNVSFEIADGEMVGLIGKNGAGKSTLLKSICKFITPSDGEIFIGGNNISDEDYRLEDTGILLEPVFFPYMSAYDNLAYYLKIHNKEQYLPEIEDTLELVGLIKNKDEKPTGFSFGMKQRLGLAQALIGHPKMLVLDEPFVGLDPVGVKDIITALKKKVKEEGMQAIISSHQLFELDELCERVLVLFNGELVFDGVTDHTQKLLITLDGDYKGEEVDGIEETEDNSVIEASMEEADKVMRYILKNNKVIKIENKKNPLEQFFEN